MTVRIAPDALERIWRAPGRIVVQVQDASDAEAAARALERARPEIGTLALKAVREVERIPTGPFVMVVDRDDGRKRLLGVPDVVAAHLEADGVEGTVACIDQGGLLTSSLWGLPTLGPGVICRLYPPPPEIVEDAPTWLPTTWLAEAVAWLTDGLQADHHLWAEVGMVEFSLDAGQARTFLEDQRRRRRSVLAVAARSRPDDASGADVAPVDPAWFCADGGPRPLRALAVCSGPSTTHLALAAGGPGASADLPAIFEGFTALARRLVADVAYGFVDLAPTFLRFAGVHHPLEPFCDEAAFDGFPYQVLGPGHLDRLGGPPPGARPLGGGRVEVAVDDLQPWIDAATGPPAGLGWRGGAVRQSVQRLLGPCLGLDPGVLGEERWERVKRRRLDLEDLAVPQYRFDPPPGPR